MIISNLYKNGFALLAINGTILLSALGLANSALAQDKKYDFNEAKMYDRAEEFAVVMTWHKCRLTPELVKTELPAAGFTDKNEIEMSKRILIEEGRLIKEGNDLILKGPECMPPVEVRRKLLAAFAKSECKIDFKRFRTMTKKMGLDRALVQDQIQRMLKNGEAIIVEGTNELKIKPEACKTS